MAKKIEEELRIPIPSREFLTAVTKHESWWLPEEQELNQMPGKAIEEMSDEELTAEIEEMQRTRIPTGPLPKQPKRRDETGKKPKRRSVMDQLEEG